MTTWIAFFRGINVGGAHSLPMKQLAIALEAEGLKDVRTYIQSGNAVFGRPKTTAPKLATLIAACVRKEFGFEPRVLVLQADELASAARGNPFPQADDDPKSLHLFFLERAPKNADMTALNALKAPTEAFALKGKVFYLHTPAGFGKSKLAERAEKLLGVPATARNWRTVCAVLEMTAGTS